MFINNACYQFSYMVVKLGLCTLTLLQQRHLRSILNIRWNDFVSNETVFTRFNVVDIETLLAQNHLRWLGHLCRTGDNCDCWINFVWWVGRRFALCRSTKTLKTGNMVILKNGNILETWSNSVHDRSEWRSLIKICFECNRFLANWKVSTCERKKEKMNIFMNIIFT